MKHGNYGKKAGYLPLLPFAAIVLCYELIPLVQLFISSLTGKESGSIGLENFIKIFTTELYRKSIINSLYLSIVSALIGIAVAFLAARAINEAGGRGKSLLMMILNMTSNFAGIPLAFGFMVLMGNTGVLTLAGKQLGIPLLSEFNLYSGQGLMLVYIYFQIPLATLLLIPSFSGLNPAWRDAATILKASPLDYWLRIAIPNLMPAILGTLSVLFANALAAYATTYALVTNNYALLSLQITSKYKGDVQIDKATGGALAMVLILLMAGATLLNNYFTSRSAKGRSLI